ncbi:MAG: MlaD family protein [Planctomycetota bacterium]|jgi:phospholipid/cholesterol/gamma-HCH transport system substrate-binding protein/paraquat-inducible protein B
MSAKPNYFAIGIFVIVACALIVAAVVFFGSGLLGEEKIYFETYFDGSVSGLAIGAPIELRGVRMGQVEKIAFAQSEYKMEIGSEDYLNYGNYVMVLVSIDVERLPAERVLEERSEIIRQLTARGFRLRLASSLLTGQAYLQGDYLDPERYPVIKVPWTAKHIYISSAPGEFTTMKQSVDAILAKLEQVDTERIGDLIAQLLASANQAIDDANIPQISSRVQTLVTNTDQAIQGVAANANQAIADANIPAIGDQAQSLLAEARQTNQHLQELLRRPDKTQSQMANIAVMIANLNKTLTRIDRLIVTQGPQIEQALANLRVVSADLKELTSDLKQHPSQLIRSQPPSESEISNE